MTTLRVYPNLSPRIVEVLDATEITVQEIVDLTRDWEDDEANMTRDALVDAAGKEPLGGDVYVGITATFLNTQLRFSSRPEELATGTVTTGNAGGITLHDTSGLFETNLVYPGCTVVNNTTTAMETVTEVTSEIELQLFALGGGSRNDWQVGDSYSIYPNVQCKITGGNLVAKDALGAEMSPILQSPNVQIIRSSSSSATLQELEAIQYASYQNAVWVDISSSNYGTGYPNGNREFPVNNLTDAVSIATNKGFSTIQILTSMTLDSGTDLRNLTIMGNSRASTVITISDAAQVDNVTIRNCNILGVMDGGLDIHNCMVGDLTYVNGNIYDSGLYGTIVLDGNEEAVLANCYTVDQDNPPTIDMNISGQDLAMPNYSGIVTIQNLSSDSEEIGVGLNAGVVNLESSISAGTIIIAGTGLVNDNSTGTASVNIDGLINNALISEAVWDETRSGHTTPGTFGATDEWAGEVDEDAIADAVWDETLGDHLAAGTTGKKLYDGGTGGGLTSDETAAAVWNALKDDYGTPGTMGWLQGLLESGIISKPRIIPGD